MAQPHGDRVPKERPKGACIGIDFGAARGKAYISTTGGNPADSNDYPLDFPMGASKLTEFDTTVVFLKGQLDLAYRTGLTHPGACVLNGIKPALMGLEPFASVLAEKCKPPEDGPPQFTPTELIRTVFKHIYDRAREHLHQEYDFWFDDIECVLTYPNSGNKSWQICLLQEARAAGFNVTKSVSEPMAAAYGYNAKSTLTSASRDDAILFADIGAATTDLTVIRLNADGQIVQACPSHGVSCGGQSVDQVFRKYLQDNYPNWKALFDDKDWISQILPHVEECKRGYGFDNDSDQRIRYGDRTVHIAPLIMKSFFESLLNEIVEAALRSCEKARDAGVCISTIVVCGSGGAGNDQFFQDLSERLQQKTGITSIKRNNDTGGVAKGALRFGRDPLVEDFVSAQKLAIMFDGDYDEHGEDLEPGKVYKGLAWFIPEEGEPIKAFSVPYEKDIDPWSTDKGDHVIETPVYGTADTSDTFSKQIIGPNKLIKWPYKITFPVTDEILEQLIEVGSFSGKIPHKKWFPRGDETEESLIKFLLTVQPAGKYNHILMGQFWGLLPDGSRFPLENMRYATLPLVPRSQFLNERTRSNQSFELRVSGEALQPTSEQESPVSPEGSEPLTLSPSGGVVIGTRAKSQPANPLGLTQGLSPGSVVRRPRSSGIDVPVSPERSSPTLSLPESVVIRTRAESRPANPPSLSQEPSPGSVARRPRPSVYDVPASPGRSSSPALPPSRGAIRTRNSRQRQQQRFNPVNGRTEPSAAAFKEAGELMEKKRAMDRQQAAQQQQVAV